MTDPADMTPEQLRVEIAEWAGWRSVPVPFERDGILIGKNFNGPCWYHPDKPGCELAPPNYCNDLEVMAEVLAKLNRAQRYEWTRRMREVINEQATAEQLNPDTKYIEDFYFYNATALHRAIAFVRVIRG